MKASAGFLVKFFDQFGESEGKIFGVADDAFFGHIASESNDPGISGYIGKSGAKIQPGFNCLSNKAILT